jgi:hypothetical protein
MAGILVPRRILEWFSYILCYVRADTLTIATKSYHQTSKDSPLARFSARDKMLTARVRLFYTAPRFARPAVGASEDGDNYVAKSELPGVRCTKGAL